MSPRGAITKKRVTGKYYFILTKRVWRVTCKSMIRGGEPGMFFKHSDDVWRQFPQLRALVMVVRGVRKADANAIDLSQTLSDVGRTLDTTSESELEPIQAWRQAYAAMGLKPTQYRCAAEALLRRFRKVRDLPRFHPLVDVLNAESMKAAIPIAAFDIARIKDGITVRPASGTEIYTTFQGEIENPAEGEIVFADAEGQAHSRRWVYRQGAASVVRGGSDSILIVAEAMHGDAATDLETLEARIRQHAGELGISVSEQAMISPHERLFEFKPPE